MISSHSTDAGLLDVLALEVIEENIFRSSFTFDEKLPLALFGGQVAAQALIAAGRTVDPARLAHSLHGYFLRGGDAKLPVVFTVYRDRDGTSFSARRVVAVQKGAVIFNMAASFHRQEQGAYEQHVDHPDVPAPEECEPLVLPRLFSVEGRAVPQPYAHRDIAIPTRFWSRVTAPLGDDPLLHAAALTYVSDVSTGNLPSEDGEWLSFASIDHAVWFHRPLDLNDWQLSDYHPRTAGGGRGLYNGSIFDRGGELVATFSQEGVYRSRAVMDRLRAQIGY